MSLQNPNLLEKIGWRIEALAYDAVSGLLRALPALPRAIASRYRAGRRAALSAPAIAAALEHPLPATSG